MNAPPPERKRFWTRSARTRRHVYYAPANDTPGLILFGLIGLGGAVALAVGAWHLSKPGGSGKDWVLVVIGAALVWLALVQSRRLWSR